MKMNIYYIVVVKLNNYYIIHFSFMENLLKKNFFMNKLFYVVIHQHLFMQQLIFKIPCALILLHRVLFLFIHVFFYKD